MIFAIYLGFHVAMSRPGLLDLATVYDSGMPSLGEGRVAKAQWF